MKPMMVRIQGDMVQPVKREAKRQGISCAGVVHQLVSTYFASDGRVRQIQLNPIPVNGNDKITIDDMVRFIRINDIQHCQFAKLMLVRPETITRWLGEDRVLHQIYQDRFRRVRKHYPQHPPI